MYYELEIILRRILILKNVMICLMCLLLQISTEIETDKKNHSTKNIALFLILVFHIRIFWLEINILATLHDKAVLKTKNHVCENQIS